MNRKVLAALTALGLGTVAAFSFGVASVGAKSGKVPVKDGVYYQAAGKQNAYIGAWHGTVGGVTARLVFKQAGKPCDATGLYPDGGVWKFVVAPSKGAVRPSSRNRFSFKGRKLEQAPRFKSSVTGRFISKKKATFTVKGALGKCRASKTFNKAKWRSTLPTAALP